jgi:hypothetical protein
MNYCKIKIIVNDILIIINLNICKIKNEYFYGDFIKEYCTKFLNLKYFKISLSN